MSDALFALYRYLSRNQDHKDENNPYTVAWRRLDALLGIQKELDYWGRYIIDYGGINWEDADVIKDRIIQGCKTVLCEASDGSSAKALVDFAATHVNLACTDYGAIMIGLEALRAQQIEELKDQ